MHDTAVSSSDLGHWRYFASEARRHGAPLYERLARAAATDEKLCAFADGARPGQPRAHILLGAVHFLLLRGDAHPLRGYYRNLGGTAEGDPFPAFRDFVESRRAALAPLVASRITNTSEVARSAFLAPVFRAIAAGEPLHLIEIGPGAGLNLIWDRYLLRYRHAGSVIAANPEGIDVGIDCELRGGLLPPIGPAPRVASRVGLERHPVDLSDPAEFDWLKALVWPDEVRRFARLGKALDAVAADPPRILAGNALDLLPEALAEPPPHETVCVYHTMVTYQFSDEMREALDAMMVVAGLRRPVWRVSLEHVGEGENRITATAYRSGTEDQSLFARCDGHGEWLEWLDASCQPERP